MSILPGGTPGNAGFEGGYQASPHAGLPGKEDRNAEPNMESRARNALLLGLLAIPFSVFAGIPAMFVGAHALRRITGRRWVLEGPSTRLVRDRPRRP